MKIIKQITISIFTALFVFGSFNLYAVDVDFDFRNTSKAYYKIFDHYHAEMNEFFNHKVLHLKDLMEDENFLNNPKKAKDFYVPVDINMEKDSLETIVSKCTKNEINNVSSFCVSMEALSIYMEYVDVLGSIKGRLEPTGNVNIKETLYEVASRNEAIEAEVEDARRVMENTVAVYNEFAHAYPMHMEYRKIIKGLLKYKLALKDIRKETQFFPIKFIDATTAQCQ